MELIYYSECLLAGKPKFDSRKGHSFQTRCEYHLDYKMVTVGIFLGGKLTAA